MPKARALLFGLALMLTLMAFSWATQKDDEKTGPATKTVSGRVTKMEETLLTIEAKDSTGKPNPITVVVNEDTQVGVDLAIGTEVTIEYKELEANRKIATKILSKHTGKSP